MSRRLSVGRLSRMHDRALAFDESISVVQIENRITELRTEFTTYRTLLDNDITLATSDELEEEFQEAERSFEDALDHLIELKSKLTVAPVNTSDSLHEFLKNQQKVLTALTENRRSGMLSALPQISVPSFSGNINEWISFRDLFLSTIHNNNDLDDVQKMQFLQSSVSGEAASLIRNIPISAANYIVAWNTLLDSFNNSSTVINSILARFFQCEPVSSSQANLKQVYNCFRETFEMLKNQGPYAESRDPIAIFLMLQKLDADTDLAWAKHSKNIKTPTIHQFLNFLKDQCLVLDRRSLKPSPRSNSSSKNQNSLKVNTFTTFHCFFCSEAHSIYSCSKFAALAFEAREKFIRSQSRCFNCLAKGHNLKTCTSSKKCTICQNKHNTLLHRTDSNQKPTTPKPKDHHTNVDGNSEESKLITLNKIYSICASSSMLPTAVINVISETGAVVQTRALLDSGAQTTLISEVLVNKLGLLKSRGNFPLQCLVDSAKVRAKGSVSLNFQSHVNGSSFQTTALVMNSLLGVLPQCEIPIHGMDQLQRKFQLADPTFNQPNEINVILAAPFLFSILKPSLYFEERNQIYVQASQLGDLICSASGSPSGGMINSIVVDEDKDQILRRFWEIEEASFSSTSSSLEQNQCETFYNQTTIRLPSGRFSVRLPFKFPTSYLGESFRMAYRRFLNLEKKLLSDRHLREEYCKFMADYESSGHMIATDLSYSQLPIPNFVIPHHGIWQSGPSGMKLRVVFDASSKSSSGHSLNDILHCGPKLQVDITDIINQFRIHRFVLTSDVEQMYRQILVDRNDQDCQLILWRSSPSDRMKIYRLQTITYGETSSPYLALRTLNELAETEKMKYHKAAQIIIRNRYVDDIFFGSNSVHDLRLLKDEVISLLNSGGFKLKKWASNCPELLDEMSRSDLANPLIFSDIGGGPIKTLGIRWYPETDAFSYRFDIPDISHCSKRALLSDTARLFDPMGWISPVILSFKALFQETWIRNLDWDDLLPEDLNQRWQILRDDLHRVSEISIPRYLGGRLIDFHGFADASKAAYAAVIYARTLSENDEVQTHLIVSKTKLAPIKAMSIPRLELCAAHLLAKLVERIKTHFDGSVRFILWSDSSTVLAWLKSLPRKYNSFVSNRVSDILECCGRSPWRYVKSDQNPADVASRGTTASKLCSHKLWWKGPDFLQEKNISFTVAEIFETSEEMSHNQVLNVIQPESFWIEVVSKFSNFSRLIRTICFLFRAKTRFRDRSSDFPNALTVNELEFVKIFMIKKIQLFYFGDEISRLQKRDNLRRHSILRKLFPFLDSNGVLRVGGRLENSVYEYDRIHLIILPKCHFSDLIISKAHLDLLHGGLTVTCTSIRQTYWIIQLQRSVKSCINRCVVCTRYRGETFNPPMGPLPRDRLELVKPFFTTGVDFAGPMTLRPYVGRGKISIKGYIAVFVCMGTRAVHLELVMSLSTTSLIMAIRRFLSRRGQCQKFVSDNGRNFVGTNRVLSDYFKLIQTQCTSNEISDFLTEHSIRWEFIPRYSPHFGGLWEAAVKSTKRHLSRTFDDSTLTIEEFQTALAQIESILNSRPLTPLVFEDTLNPLTPQHLLTGDAAGYLSDSIIASDSGNDIRRRQLYLQALINQFWCRWRTEFLPSLNTRSKWTKISKEIKIGDIVLIKRSVLSPCLWPFARVEQCYPGHDNIIRVVDVRTANGIKRESVRRLILLNVDA